MHEIPKQTREGKWVSGVTGEGNKEREKEKEELQIQFLSSFVKQNVWLNHSCSFVVVFIVWICQTNVSETKLFPRDTEQLPVEDTRHRAAQSGSWRGH